MTDRQALMHALEIDREGNWEAAHKIVQNIDSLDAYHTHAYLHRKEGDIGNADYWYARAKRTRPDSSLTEEWQQLRDAFSN